MMRRKLCPDCGSYETEHVHTEWFPDMIEETRICNDCPAQFTNSFDLFDQQLEEVPA